MVGAIILAAGSSRRFGDDKRKATLQNGNMLIENTINIAAKTLGSVLVVLRFGDRAFADELDTKINIPGISYFLAPDSAKGMAHSLSNAIQKAVDMDAAMIFLADMPYIKEETIKKLINAFNANKDLQPIVIPTSNGTPGHPVIFDKTYFNEIQSLEGDRGARPVVDAHQDKLIQVEIDDPGILRDIDTLDDIESLSH